MWECHSWNGTCIFSLIRKILWTRQLVSCLHLSRRRETPGQRSSTAWKCLTGFRWWLLNCNFETQWVCLQQGIEEHKKLIASVTKEKELKTRIKELIRYWWDTFSICTSKHYRRYRKNGIHQLSEAEQYEAQRVRRNKLVNHSRPARSRAARYGRWVTA